MTDPTNPIPPALTGEQKPRHLARLLVTPELVVGFLTEGWAIRGVVRLVEHGLPPGTRLVSARWDDTELGERYISLLLEHESFAPVPVGVVPPVASPPQYQVTNEATKADVDYLMACADVIGSMHTATIPAQPATWPADHGGLRSIADKLAALLPPEAK